ncbi:MAG: cell division protein ZapA [Bacteroidota bacterium]|jgi:cell division protein ZapA
MSDENIRIKVALGGRTYPLTIPRSEEEQVRKAVAMIQQTVTRFEERYAVGDKQDALAMCALQLANQVASLHANPVANSAVDAPEDERLKQIQGQLDAVLGTRRTAL